jgi:nicotinamide-nucleotide amidase
MDALVSLAAELGEILRSHRDSLVTAESCTGGWVAQCMTAVAGSSEWFDRGFVTYSNAAKMEQLGVLAQTLAAHGAVSEQTAAEMARGALGHSQATVAVAVTGIAGPGGGTAEKPVGTVCFGWARRGVDSVLTERHLLKGDREAVRRQSVEIALRGVAARMDRWIEGGRDGQTSVA